MSSVHVLNSNKTFNVRAVGVSIIPHGHHSKLDCAFFLFFFYLLMLQQWNLISNLSPLHQTLSHPLCSLMHTLKRTGGPKVGFGPGVRGVCGSQRGIYSLP